MCGLLRREQRACPRSPCELSTIRRMRSTAFPALVLSTTTSLVLLLGACASTGDAPEADEAEEPAAAATEAVAHTPVQAQGKKAAATPTSPDQLLEDVDKAFEARREAFRRANSARASQNAGTFNVTMTFAATGEVVECRMLSTDFRDDPTFNAAVMAEVWRLRLPPRPGAREFVVSSYPIEFSARSEAMATPPPTPTPMVSSPPPMPAPARP